MYVFAVLGMELYGGLLVRGNPALDGTAYDASDYYGFRSGAWRFDVWNGGGGGRAEVRILEKPASGLCWQKSSHDVAPNFPKRSRAATLRPLAAS